MEPRTYTLKEAVFALNRSGSSEEAARLTRHIRHWTTMDLLEPEGAKHTGTGRAREYSANTVRRAAVLVELAKWRVPMTMMEAGFEMFEAEFEDEWADAAHDEEPIYLVMSWSDIASSWSLQRDHPQLGLIDEREGLVHEEPYRNDFPIPASVIVINLSRLLRWVKL